MKNFKLSISNDLFFSFIAIFCVFYAIFIKNGLKFYISAILSAMLSLVFSFVLAIVFIKIFNKKTLLSFNEKEKVSLTNYLTFLPRKKLLEFLMSAFKNDGLFLEIFNNGLLCKDKKVFIYPIFNGGDTTKQNVVNAYLKKEDNRLVIISGSYESKVTEISSIVTDITFYDINDLYITLKNINAMPKIDTPIINKKKRLITTLKGLFNKKHAKILFISGIVTLLFSTLTYFKSYYIIVGSVFLVLSAVCKFFAPATTSAKGIRLN